MHLDPCCANGGNCNDDDAIPCEGQQVNVGEIQLQEIKPNPSDREAGPGEVGYYDPDLDWGKEDDRDQIPPIARYAEWHLVINLIFGMLMFKDCDED